MKIDETFQKTLAKFLLKNSLMLLKSGENKTLKHVTSHWLYAWQWLTAVYLADYSLQKITW